MDVLTRQTNGHVYHLTLFRLEMYSLGKNYIEEPREEYKHFDTFCYYKTGKAVKNYSP